MSGFAQRLHDHRQHVRRRNVIERAPDRLREFHVRVELGNQFANKRHVDRPGNDVDPIRAHVGRQFYFADHDRFFRQRGQSGQLTGFNRLRNIWLTRTNTTHTARSASFVGLLENVLEHVHYFARVRALEFNKFAHHFGRWHVHLIDDAGERPNHARIFRDQNRARFWQRQKRCVRLRRRKILAERLLQFLRIGIAQLEQITDDVIAVRNLGFVGDDRHSGRARIFSGADNFNDVAVFRRNEGIAVEQQIHLDDFDRFFSRHFFSDENVDLALDEIVHHQFFPGELLVKPEHVRDIAVWKLELHHLRRAGSRIRRSSRRRPCLSRLRGRSNHARHRWRGTRELTCGRRRFGRLRNYCRCPDG